MDERELNTTLYAEFTVRPGCETRVAQLLRELTAHVRDEPGNLMFNAYTRVEHPNEYVVFEIYRDDAAFRSHLASDHGARFNRDLTDLIEGDGSTLTLLEPLE